MNPHHEVGTAPAADPASDVPVDDLRVVPVRHWGRWVSGALALAVMAAVVWQFATSPNVDYGVVGDYVLNSQILAGARATLLLSVLAQLIGTLLGVLMAVMRLSANPVVRGLAWFYVWLFRGTPVLVQLLIWANLALIFPTIGVPFLGLEARTVELITPFVAAMIGLAINEGAYMAEIVRAGILSVDSGQTEAAQAIGMTRTQVMGRVVLPQAMRVIIPPTGNEFINMLKTSSLASVIAFPELLQRAQNVYIGNFKTIELLFVASIWYLIFTSVFSVGQYYVERRFARGAAHALPETPWQRVRRNLRPGRTTA